jgi:hypothetical protein
VRASGACGSKNVGTSNRNDALVMSISQGLVGPKGMAKAVLDGHRVNIP